MIVKMILVMMMLMLIKSRGTKCWRVGRVFDGGTRVPVMASTLSIPY